MNNSETGSPRPSVQHSIRKIAAADAPAIFNIINVAAVAYKEVIPADCYHQPYMPMEELLHEMGNMSFYGWVEDGICRGVIGFQQVKDVTLIRHAYVLPNYQRNGVCSRLIDYLKHLTETEYLLVGTWAAAIWAISLYRKHGFMFMPDKDELLMKYWDIPMRQVETSVVLGLKIRV